MSLHHALTPLLRFLSLGWLCIALALAGLPVTGMAAWQAGSATELSAQNEEAGTVSKVTARKAVNPRCSLLSAVKRSLPLASRVALLSGQPAAASTPSQTPPPPRAPPAA